MKKFILTSALMLMTLFQGCITTTTPVSASSSMSTSKIRTHARFITDRMAYELDFTPMQYSDCYEINYDFIYCVAPIMSDVVHGYYDAINDYYRYLDYRNDDLRYIMTASQYIRFMSKEYFYRPLYSSGNSWNFRIYTTYSNRSFFYYDAPPVYRDYRGAHSRTYYSNGFYGNRYNVNDRYTGHGRILGSQHFDSHRRNDFGTNLRERNQKPDYNNYNNRNSNNRTADPRYRDNSGNRNTPYINSRSGESRGNQSTQNSGNVQSGNNSRPGVSSRGEANSNAQRGTTTGTRTNNGTSTGSRSGNVNTDSRSGESRGNRSSQTGNSSRGSGRVNRR